MEPTRDDLLAMYYLMELTRALEDAVRELYQQRRIAGTVYTARGLEATTVGAALALEPGDVLAPQHRDLGALLARDVTPREIMAQWLNRATALDGGRDGQLHIGEMGARRILPATGLPGLALPVAAGAALAAQRQGARRVVLAFIGDGGSNTGDFHEAMNLAATLDLPLICVIENNGYAAATPTSSQFHIKHLADRAAAYGMPGHVVDGNDPLAVYELTAHAVERARAGRGPSLIEAKTFRMQGHSTADQGRYMPPATLDDWRQRDPLDRFTRHLENLDVLNPALAREYTARIAQTVQDAVTYALNSPTPDPAMLTDHVYAPSSDTPLSTPEPYIADSVAQLTSANGASDHAGANGTHPDVIASGDHAADQPTNQIRALERNRAWN
jgi:TPP-dependent pyruvate/acetoin dehydrogenase alpha subunit